MSDFVLTAAKWALIFFSVGNVALVVFTERKNLGFLTEIARRVTVSMFFQCFGLFVATVFLGTLLIAFVPGMKYGWLHLFLPTGGNVLISPVMDATNSGFWLIKLIPLVFIAGFAFTVPFIAHLEERAFRSGYHDWASIRRQSVKFGLVHCLVGVPIGAGIALIMTGFFYGYKYRRAFAHSRHWVGVWDRAAADRDAVLTCTAYHSVYNLIIAAILLTMAATALAGQP